VIGGLVHTGNIRRNPPRIRLRILKEKDGDLRIHPEGGTTFQRSLFLEALEEILDPVENPRYLIRQVHQRKKGSRHVAYHAVPTAIGRKKAFAERFVSLWKRFVGPADLIYTRTPAGRRELVKARLQSLSVADAPNAERVEIWR
jgi:hypothetical protein